MVEALVIIVDASVLEKMFLKDDKDSNKILKKISDLKAKNAPFTCVTTLTGFMRAIWKLPPNLKVDNIQNILDIIKVVPSAPHYDFKNEKHARDDIINLAKKFSSFSEKLGASIFDKLLGDLNDKDNTDNNR